MRNNQKRRRDKARTRAKRKWKCRGNLTAREKRRMAHVTRRDFVQKGKAYLRERKETLRYWDDGYLCPEEVCDPSQLVPVAPEFQHFLVILQDAQAQ